MNKVTMMLDSGAYSAWKLRKEVDMERYIDFVHRYRHLIDSVVNVDVIPGEFGRIPTPAEVEQSARIGYANFKQFRREGIEVMPVFHQGENTRWLRKMIDDGCDRIGISPANDRTTTQKIAWLDEIFGHLCGKDGYTRVKTHGFGVTAMEIMHRYPWYSVDSGTWFMIPAYGGIPVPALNRDGSPDFSRPTQIYTVSRSGPRSTARTGMTWDRLGRNTQERINQWVASLNVAGLSNVEQLRDDYRPRSAISAAYFREMSAHRKSPRFVGKSRGLFTSLEDFGVSCSSPPWSHMIVVYTMTYTAGHSWAIKAAGCQERLLTHYYLEPLKFDLEQFVVNDTWVDIL